MPNGIGDPQNIDDSISVDQEIQRGDVHHYRRLGAYIPQKDG